MWLAKFESFVVENGVNDLPRPSLDRPFFQKRIAQLASTISYALIPAKSGKRSGASRPVVAVDRDIFLGEVAGQNAVAAFAEAECDLDLDLRLLHRR
jgi:hypothetical protein